MTENGKKFFSLTFRGSNSKHFISCNVVAKSHGFVVRLMDLKIGKTLTTDQKKCNGRQNIELCERISHFFSALFWLWFFIYNFLCNLKISNYFHIAFYGHTHLKNILGLNRQLKNMFLWVSEAKWDWKSCSSK